MKRTEVLGHKLRFMHGSDAFQEHKNYHRLWYVCKECELEIYWNGKNFCVWNTLTYTDYSFTMTLNISCNEYIIKKILE